MRCASSCSNREMLNETSQLFFSNPTSASLPRERKNCGDGVVWLPPNGISAQPLLAQSGRSRRLEAKCQSNRNASDRNLWPVAANIALPTAGAIHGVPISPTPPISTPEYRRHFCKAKVTAHRWPGNQRSRVLRQCKRGDPKKDGVGMVPRISRNSADGSATGRYV